MNRRLFIFAAVAALMAASASPARGEELKEYQIKAAFIYNFTQFIQWPEGAFASAEEPFVVVVLGEDPFDGALDAAMAGKTVMNRAVVVRHCATVAQLRPAHLIYVAKSEDARLVVLFEKLAGKPVLTIGETDAFPWAGGTLRFFFEDNRVRFEVNLEAAKAAQLEISSKLLKLARIFKS